jgi:UDP-N-acetylglucosamine diphosphorylase/glucosamine-1-phosphate N-acetyltransferase
MSNNRAAIILAAGKGKRMKSDLPKVLHRINGKPLITYLMDTILQLEFDRIAVVIGHKGQLVIDALNNRKLEFIWQHEQRGTGHAVMMTESRFGDFRGAILVAAGDVPFLSVRTIRALFDVYKNKKASAVCLTADFDDPTGYGRIIRQATDSDMLADIIEDKDADSETKKITEINTGTFCFDSGDLFAALHRLDDNNAQREYYLTDTIKILRRQKKLCAVWKAPDPLEVKGVNSMEQLKSLENEIKERKLIESRR